MPELKLIAPDARHPTWRIRGTYLGVRIDRSAGTRDRKAAERIRQAWQHDIEGGAVARPGETTFAAAALSYMQGGGERRHLPPVLSRIGTTLLAAIDQALIDQLAAELLPEASPATRNRQIYTPIIAVSRHAGLALTIRRPRGARGQRRIAWLTPEQAFALIAAARNRADRLEAAIDEGPRFSRGARAKAATSGRRFTALLVWLLYTGCRLSEALRVRPQDIELDRSFAFCGMTKTGEPRAVHLPPVLVVELASIEWGRTRVFGISAKAGRLYARLEEIAAAAGIEIPDRVAFHIFRHTWATWMRRYGGLDTAALVSTGAWGSREAAGIYEHVEAREEARKADLLPVPGVEKSGRR